MHMSRTRADQFCMLLPHYLQSPATAPEHDHVALHIRQALSPPPPRKLLPLVPLLSNLPGPLRNNGSSTCSAACPASLSSDAHAVASALPDAAGASAASGSCPGRRSSATCGATRSASGAGSRRRCNSATGLAAEPRRPPRASSPCRSARSPPAFCWPALARARRAFLRAVGRRRCDGHKCGVCDRGFASGQALGRHKRYHWDRVCAEAETAAVATSGGCSGLATSETATVLDLNLPPLEPPLPRMSDQGSGLNTMLELKLGN